MVYETIMLDTITTAASSLLWLGTAVAVLQLRLRRLELRTPALKERALPTELKTHGDPYGI